MFRGPQIQEGATTVGHAATQPDLDSRKYRRRYWTLGVLSLSLLVIALDVTVLNVAIPTLQRDLDASAASLQWIINAYILVFAGLLLTMGTLGDRFGRRRALEAGMVIFAAASLAAAFSETSSQLIAARAGQGIGGALIMPSTLSILVDVFPRAERARAIGIWAAVAALGIPIGMVLGGWLLEEFSWGAIFLINLPVVAVILLSSRLLIPESKDPSPGKIDVPGAVISMAALSALIYSLIEAPERGWLDPVTLGGFAAAAAAGVLFVYYELRTPQPMLDIRLFRNARLSAGAGAVGIVFMAMLGTLFLITQYLQFVRDYSPLDTGLRLVPLATRFHDRRARLGRAGGQAWFEEGHFGRDAGGDGRDCEPGRARPDDFLLGHRGAAAGRRHRHGECHGAGHRCGDGRRAGGAGGCGVRTERYHSADRGRSWDRDLRVDPEFRVLVAPDGRRQ